MEKVMQFLKDLEKNNNKEWFHSHKAEYEASRNKILFLTELLINEIRKFDSEIPVMDPKDCMFRIFRDVRFSADKSPYKTHFGSYIAKGGRKSQMAGYYFHISPDESFAGGGIYMPEANLLKEVRLYMAEHGDEFKEIVNNKDFKEVFPALLDDKLKTAPKGFLKEHEHIDLLCYKSFVYSKTLGSGLFSNENYIETIVKAFKQLSKVNTFINLALKNIEKTTKNFDL